MTKTFLTAEWRKLLMAQYVVAAETLLPYLPSGVELDLFNGQCFVSLVGFLFDRVRLKGLRIPFHNRFEEVNLRFYVRRVDADGSARRGVVFVREFVPKIAITLIANALYEEPYATLPTGHSFAQRAGSQHVEYSWKHGDAWQVMGAEAALDAVDLAAGSVEEFITEHYFGYTKRRNGSTSEYAVEHPRWQVYPVLGHEVRADFGSLYGPAFAELRSNQPANILLAEGSAISVGGGLELKS